MDDLQPPQREPMIGPDGRTLWANGLITYNGDPPQTLFDPRPQSAEEEPSKAPPILDVDETVTISFKKATPIHIEIDPDQLRWADIQVIQKVTSGAVTEEEAGEQFMDLLTKLTGQDARKLPMRVINGIVAQLQKIAGGGDTLKN